MFNSEVVVVGGGGVLECIILNLHRQNIKSTISPDIGLFLSQDTQNQASRLVNDIVPG